MKICLLGPTYPLRGGIAHYTTILYLELKKKHEVHLISLARQYPSLLFPGKSQLDESGQYIEVENKPLLDSLCPWTWYKTAREIRRLAPDVLVIQWWHPFFGLSFGTIAFLVRISGKTKVFYLCHNVTPHDRSVVDRALTRFAFSAADGFVLHSGKDEQDLRKIYPMAKVERIMHPIYKAFSSKQNPTTEIAKKSLDIKGKMLLFFGFIRPYKGLIYLIKAMPQVLSRLDCTLYIVGEFYEKTDRYIAEIEKLGIQQKVRIVDRYVANEEVPLYFCAADVVVLPYTSATQSGVVQMAYAFEKPVITTNTGGLPEAVRDGETGLIVPPEDPDALAEAIIFYFKENKEVEFAKNLMKQKEVFSWDKVQEALEHLASDTPGKRQ